MPIYEFYCGACRKKVEVFRRSFSATAPVVCPQCGGIELRRLVSRFAVHRSVSEFGSDDEQGYIEGPEFEEMVSRMEAGEMPEDDEFGADDADDFDAMGAP
jgi:putative FmdB family regulatory protein